MAIVEFLWTIVQLLSSIVLWISIVLFLLKTLWNLCVPYAIIREALQRPRERHGWSMFVLFDIALLVLAVAASALGGQLAVLSPWQIGLYGLGTIIASYVHLAIVLLLLGSLLGLFPKDDQNNHGIPP
jgi:hypothetical protein